MNRVVGSAATVAAFVLGVAACSTSDVVAVPPAITGTVAAGRCPETRATARAPDSYLARTNPLLHTAANLERGRALFQHEAGPKSCAGCHGARGDGTGPEGAGLAPPPRNFTCARTMDALPDGQLYWVIENGSGDHHDPARQGAQQIARPGRGVPATAMRGYRDSLDATEIWQLVLYIRSLQAQANDDRA